MTVFAPAGAFKPSKLTGHPGLVLSGGGLSQMPHPPVYDFIEKRIHAPMSGRAGNLLILKASGERDYSDDFYKESRLALIQEILIPPCAARSEVEKAVSYVDKADAVLFAGGDQANYAAWKGGKLVEAVRRLYQRGGVVGGGSAGLAIQGEVIYDSVAADKVLPDDEDLQTPRAIHDPFDRAISFTTGYFNWPPLRNTITDTHFGARNRFGRLTAFMARIAHDRLMNGNTVYGLGIDEGDVVLVDAEGHATMYQRARMQSGYVPRGVWLLSDGRATRLAPGRPLAYDVLVRHFSGSGTTFDFKAPRAPGYRVQVDGARAKSPYKPANPYR